MVTFVRNNGFSQWLWMLSADADLLNVLCFPLIVANSLSSSELRWGECVALCQITTLALGVVGRANLGPDVASRWTPASLSPAAAAAAVVPESAQVQLILVCCSRSGWWFVKLCSCEAVQDARDAKDVEHVSSRTSVAGVLLNFREAFFNLLSS